MLRQLGLSKLLLSPNFQQNLNVNIKNTKKTRSSKTLSKTSPTTIDELTHPEHIQFKPERRRDFGLKYSFLKKAAANYEETNNFIYKPLDIFPKRDLWISLSSNTDDNVVLTLHDLKYFKCMQFPCNQEFDQYAAINKNLFPLQMQNELLPNELSCKTFKKLLDIDRYEVSPTEKLPLLGIENILKTVNEINTRKPIKKKECLAEKNSFFVNKKSLSAEKVHRKFKCSNENNLQLKKRLKEVKLSMRNCKVFPHHSSMYLDANKYVGHLVTHDMVQVEENNKVVPRGIEHDEEDNKS
ncbi:uncharacterized protein LOC119683170 [Teleopsis dalmanni]|uniref:uncharacterized protein LOC119683170 n=1 Tax=Teleopsis dalmanni TaxID=139649 RepID=UPI0018CD2430|nr:uncharacterized protein LOC119683170 [Teleopsis dalmanni]